MKIKSIDVVCGGYREDYGCDGYEYECSYYDQTGICVECGECVCNFGDINPITGKRINFILRFIQNRRGLKEYRRECKNENSSKIRKSKLKPMEE